MSRIILFKGLKTGEKDHWVYGHYFSSVEEDGLVHYIFNTIFGAVEVYDHSICEFTGYTGTHGTSVFEGDIVRYKGAVGKVVYEVETCMFMMCFPLNRSRWSFDSIEGPISVLGNIHYNTDLMKALGWKE